MRRTFSTLAMMGIIGAMTAAPARASLLSPGQLTAVDTAIVSPSGAVLARNDQTVVGGGPVVNPVVTLETAVIADASNPFGAGLLTFVYRFANRSDLGSNTAIGRVSLDAFSNTLIPGLLVDVGSRINLSLPGLNPDPGNEEVPDTQDRGTNIGGAVIGFNFLSNGIDEEPPSGTGFLQPGETSSLLIVRTNARSFTTGSAQAVDGAALNFNAFAPTLAAVPEPSTVGMASMGGLLGLLALRRRRRHAVIA